MYLLDNNICGELGVAWTILGYTIVLIQWAVPILLIISGMITMAKVMTESKDDSLSKAQKELVKKILSAVLVYFVIWGTKLVVNLVADNTWESCAKCVFDPFSSECSLIK